MPDMKKGGSNKKVPILPPKSKKAPPPPRPPAPSKGGHSPMNPSPDPFGQDPFASEGSKNTLGSQDPFADNFADFSPSKVSGFGALHCIYTHLSSLSIALFLCIYSWTSIWLKETAL